MINELIELMFLNSSPHITKIRIKKEETLLFLKIEKAMPSKERASRVWAAIFILVLAAAIPQNNIDVIQKRGVDSIFLDKLEMIRNLQ